jgi:hypothetical protein
LVWVLLILQLIFLHSVLLQQQALLPGLLAATQALMLCWFQRKPSTVNGEDTADDTHPPPSEADSFLGLVVGTIAGALVLSLSVQGFLIWFRVS